MPVLVFAESANGTFKKSNFEAVTYGARVAAQLNTEAFVIDFENLSDDVLKSLGEYGATKVYRVANDALKNFDAGLYAKVLNDVALKLNATTVIFSFNYSGKAIAPVLAAKMNAGYVAGAIDIPVMDGSIMKIRKNVFSGKAIALYAIHSENKIIALTPNTVAPVKAENKCSVENLEIAINATDNKVKVKEVVKASGKITLSDADIVVSAGRGLKGPENWGMVEEMASILGAATACSRPVADIHWRPHEEHVGQTGLTVRPNLYIALGISGAIQHLAGVNGSKVIVVINKDPEAPFFKAADYGIVGDVFEVVPKLNEAFKKFKAGA
ncbi:MAG: electron transfer flavoprotein subunit alpha/FixB family protein [Sphingobacteriales bacterium]|nr:MAG: electron transfer flavoprotein subunit alpha/FixB family protein [Sphingobacteriales bacterium]